MRARSLQMQKKKNHQHFKKQPDKKKKKNRKVSNDGLREMEGMAGRKEQKNVGQWRVGEKKKKKRISLVRICRDRRLKALKENGGEKARDRG